MASKETQRLQEYIDSLPEEQLNEETIIEYADGTIDNLGKYRDTLEIALEESRIVDKILDELNILDYLNDEI